MTTFNMQSTLHRALVGTLLGTVLAGCGGGGGGTPPVVTPPVITPPVIAPATEMTLSAASATAIASGAPVTLTASLNGAGTVNWALAAGSPGTLSATSGASVNYTPPAAAGVNAPTPVLISATSGSLSKTVTLTLLPDPARAGLTLLAGNIGSGSSDRLALDGNGTSARFARLWGITADAAGNVYVSDNDGLQAGRVRKIAADGTVSSLTGTTRGNADPAPLNPLLATVNDISMGADGSLYFTDTTRVFVSSSVSNNITYARKLSPSGVLSTIGLVNGSVLASPDGKLYVYNGAAISVLSPSGATALLAGDNSGAAAPADVDGSGALARFRGLADLAADKNGTLYALDAGGVRKITPDGEVSTLLRLEARPVGDSAPAPTQLGVDGNGNLLLLYRSSDPAYFDIRKLSGGAVSPLYTVGTPNGAYRNSVLRMHVLADGAVLVNGDASVTRIGTDGKATVLAGMEDDTLIAIDGQGAAARYVAPGLLAADKEGNVYSVENADNFPSKAVIRKTTPAGVASTYASADLNVRITGMAVNPAGQLLVSVVPLASGQGGGAIYMVEAGNRYTLLAGVPGENVDLPLQRDGAGIQARFGGPTLAGIDSAGNLYVQDRVLRDNATTNVRKVTPQGLVSTVSALPAGLNAAPDGNSYEVHFQRSAIYRVTPAGVRTLVAGSFSTSGYFLGTVLGVSPDHLASIGGIVPTGPRSFAVASGSAILRLVLP